MKTLREFLNSNLNEESLLGGYSEGDVYKPTNSYIVNDTSRFIGVKRKTDKYLEKEKVSTKTPKSRPALSIVELQIREELGKYITENRLNNVLSHGEHELIPQNIGSIMMSFKKDAIEEYVRENDVDTEYSLMNLINGYSRDIANMIKAAIQKDSDAILSL